MDLVPIKVKIGLREDNSAKYPDFNQLQVVKTSGMDWSHYIDKYGTGWMYDTIGHRETAKNNDEWDSPYGQQWGVILVPESFATQAVNLFPDEVKTIDETKTKSFYESRVTPDQPNVMVDAEVLESIRQRESLGIDVTEEKTKALDPDDPSPGVVKNKNKKWDDFKIKTGFQIKK